MADKTWVGGTSDDAAVDANWSPSGVPASNDKVTIPDASTTSNDCRLTAATSWGTLGIETNGILVGNGQTLTLNGGVNDAGTAADFNYSDGGQTSNVSGNLDITMRNLRSSGDRAIITAAANNIRNLKIDDFTADGGGTGKVYHFQCNLTISGDLTVEYGELNTAFSSTSYSLTVAGTTTIGPNSGAADQATLTCNASTISLGSGITSSAYGLYVNQGGTFTGGSGTHTLGSVVVRNNAAAKCTLTSGVTTINGEHGGDGRAINIEGTSATFDDGNGTVTFTFAGTTKISLAGKSLYNVIVNDSSASVEYIGDTTIDNDLTVTAGKFRYNNFHDLTVTGDVSVTGILGHPTTTTTSDSTFGSLTINSGGEYKAPSGTTTMTSKNSSNYIMDLDGTFTHNNGTVRINSTGSGDQLVDLIPSSGTLYNLEINENSSQAIQYNGNTTIANDLTIVEGKFQFYDNTNSNLTVTGDVSIEDGGQLAASGWSGAGEFGSLTIASGGTYQATSGTTTITNFNSSNNIFKTESGGTFTHNNGTVKVTTNSSGKYFRPTNVTFYNVQISNNDTGAYVRWRGTPCTISNNLTIDANSKFKPHSETQVLNVTGEVILSGTNSFLDGNDPNNDASTQDWSFGGLRINSGATYRATSGTTIMKGALRNVGGTIS